MKWEEIKANEELYVKRVEQRNREMDGSMGTKHVLPSSEEADHPDALDWFHRLMTECGVEGVDYIQEGYHQNGTYLSYHFDDWEDVMVDVRRYKEVSE